jgi:hypothetical protein
MCKGVKRSGEPCNRPNVKSTEFCKIHHYLIGYTEEMLSKLTKCSNCLRHLYLNDASTCNDCRQRGKSDKEAIKRKLFDCTEILGSGKRCSYQVSIEGHKCGKHQVPLIKQEIIETGIKKSCPNIIRGCREILPSDYDFKYCECCRMGEKLRERKRRGHVSNEEQIKTSEKIINLLENQIIKFEEFGFKIIDINIAIQTVYDKIKIYKNLISSLKGNITVDEQSDRIDIDGVNIDGVNIDGVNIDDVSIGIIGDNDNSSNNNKQDISDQNEEIYDQIDIVYRKGKCRGKIRNNSKKELRCCNKTKVDELSLCETHRYMRTYSDEMFKHLTYCTGCNKMIYIKEGKVCDKCILRADKFNSKHKNDVDNKLRCKYSNCIFAEREVGFCGNHINYNDGSTHRCKNVIVNAIETRECIKCKKINNTMYFYTISGELLDICHTCFYEDQSIAHEEIYTRSTCISVNRCLNNYKNAAKQKNRVWDLTRERFEELIRGTCHYCNAKYDGIHLMGIDRYDSSIGYIPENCVTCCRVCNVMKLNHPFNDFLQYCRNIKNSYKNNGPRDSCIRLNNEYKRWTNGLKHRKGKKEITSSLTEDSYYKILANTCYYCSNTNCFNNGLDRVNSDGNYDENNVVPACSICNIMKMDLELDTFIEKVNIIVDKFANYN